MTIKTACEKFIARGESRRIVMYSMYISACCRVWIHDRLAALATPLKFVLHVNKHYTPAFIFCAIGGPQLSQGTVNVIWGQICFFAHFLCCRLSCRCPLSCCCGSLPQAKTPEASRSPQPKPTATMSMRVTRSQAGKTPV
jgi:hypothetical protein